jgi:hypothetical protein
MTIASVSPQRHALSNRNSHGAGVTARIAAEADGFDYQTEVR